MKPKLYIFSGLPASGKSTLAKLLVEKISGTYIRIDTIEQGMRELCSFKVQGEGYRLSYRIVADNLKLGNNVIADSCNPWELTRKEWESVAIKNNADFVNIQIICSNTEEHQRRVKKRSCEIAGLTLPDWEEIQSRDYHPWQEQVITIDTADKTIENSFVEMLQRIHEYCK